jgi:hypothetical protein
MNIKGRTLFGLFFVTIFAIGLYFSTEWSLKARLFPQLIIISGLIISIYNLIKIFILQHSRESIDSRPLISKTEMVPVSKQVATPKSEWTMALWVIIFFCMIILLGFWVTIILYTILFMTIFGHENWKIVSIYAIGIWLLIYLGLSVGMSASLYGGIFGLTW